MPRTYKTGFDVFGIDDDIKAGPFCQFTVTSVTFSRLLTVDCNADFITIVKFFITKYSIKFSLDSFETTTNLLL